MNKIDVQQTGGFPLETDTLNAMQQAYDVFNSLGNIIAPLAIVSGCDITGNSVTDGVVYINGEVLNFKGGALSDTVIIQEDSESRNFENGENKIVYRTRYARFGSSVQTTNYRWADFHRTITLKEIERRLVYPNFINDYNARNTAVDRRLIHRGFIIDYSGRLDQIPIGWALCDGGNGTPDLRGRFVVSYDGRDGDYNAIGKTGGEKHVTLNVEQMPRHKHGGYTSTDGNHNHYGLTFEGSNRDNGDPGRLMETGPTESNGMQHQSNAYTGFAGNHNHSFETNDVGGNQAHENRPPYYVLAKIMFLG